MCKTSHSSKAKTLCFASMITSQSISPMIHISHVPEYDSSTMVYQFFVGMVCLATNNSLDLEEFASCAQLPRIVCKRTLGIGASPSGCVFTWAMPSCNECWHLFVRKGHLRSMFDGEN